VAQYTHQRDVQVGTVHPTVTVHVTMTVRPTATVRLTVTVRPTVIVHVTVTMRPTVSVRLTVRPTVAVRITVRVTVRVTVQVVTVRPTDELAAVRTVWLELMGPLLCRLVQVTT
jgi:hypothetical protein